MCQAYEAEKRSIILGCESMVLRGFVAARLGRPQQTNSPHGFNENVWNHGWRCWHERILPWALIKELGFERRRQACEAFNNYQELLPELEVRLERFL